MFDIREIFRRDAATYYEGDPQNIVGRPRRIFAFFAGSLLVAAVVRNPSMEFLGGALSAESILVGFGFNVLFYLVANRLTTPKKFTGIEHELQFQRLSRLSDEIFDNVSYFNIVAIAAALGSLIILLIDSNSVVANIKTYIGWICEKLSVNYGVIFEVSIWIRVILLAVLLFLICETVNSFVRTVSRVGFYFSMLKAMNEASAAITAIREEAGHQPQKS